MWLLITSHPSSPETKALVLHEKNPNNNRIIYSSSAIFERAPIVLILHRGSDDKGKAQHECMDNDYQSTRFLVPFS